MTNKELVKALREGVTGQRLYEMFWARNGGGEPPWTEQADAIRTMWDAIAGDAASLLPAAERGWRPDRRLVEETIRIHAADILRAYARNDTTDGRYDKIVAANKAATEAILALPLPPA